MTDETIFLEAIESKPCDPTPRLVYADWLDEQSKEKENTA
ncbi:MAG: TIGR02996 domain-containing protein [Planctomycetaceae bacterium]|nr:TIGR02996 domain-containing protein [Planctomycetaceae bacterium]